MCQVFISADPQSYESRTRSVRLHGVVTSIRLENLHWEVLEEIATRDGMTVTQLIAKLYDELVEARGAVGNFASFLRVSALRYMARTSAPSSPRACGARRRVCCGWRTRPTPRDGSSSTKGPSPPSSAGGSRCCPPELSASREASAGETRSISATRLGAPSRGAS